MSSPARYSIGVVCEARADQETACDLADRVFIETVGWLEEGTLASTRKWRGYDPVSTFTHWKKIKELAREHDIKIHGFGAGPAKGETVTAKKAIRLFFSMNTRPDALLLIRDSDKQPERLSGLHQARDDAGSDKKVAVGFAITKRECWVLNGFYPENQKEKVKLANVKEKLGFDPVKCSHKLTAQGAKGKNNAKKVLGDLVGVDKGRERRCWTDTPLQKLRQNGRSSGLTEYLKEVQERLATLF